MATVPVSTRPSAIPQDAPGRSVRGVPVHVAAAVILAVGGILSLWPTALALWSLWLTDPLKSIGGLMPLVSLWLILRVWRAQGWQQDGSAWGLALLVLLSLVVHLRDGAVLALVLSPSWVLTLPPLSLIAFAYASAVVLLVGGERLWWAARFPLALMLLVNPVPHVFSRLVDLPLQHASATVARGLAHALGQRLTPDQLYLMFTPNFGMFIAPGCNGIRGSITMGLLALVAGYLYRFRWKAWMVTVVAAVLLGYVFNLLRLCALVLYYVLGLRSQFLQHHAEGADYCIGAGLFFLATVLLFAAIRRWGAGGDLQLPRPLVPATLASHPSEQGFWLRCSGFVALLVLSFVPYAAASRRQEQATVTPVAFPAHVGVFQRQRTWTETLDTGQTIFLWATYSVPGGATSISLGISPVLGAHDTLLCHTARGEDWLWHGPLSLPTMAGPVAFSAAFFSDGAVRSVEASTLCSAAGCGQWTSERTHLGFIFSRPEGRNLLGMGNPHPVPVLLRAETAEALPPEQARAKLIQDLQVFARTTSFGAFTYRYLRP